MAGYRFITLLSDCCVSHSPSSVLQHTPMLPPPHVSVGYQPCGLGLKAYTLCLTNHRQRHAHPSTNSPHLKVGDVKLPPAICAKAGCRITPSHRCHAQADAPHFHCKMQQRVFHLNRNVRGYRLSPMRTGLFLERL